MESFEVLSNISDLINSGNEEQARHELIKLLSVTEKPYSTLLNHLIREVGLYPYLEPDTAEWNDQFIYEMFKTDIGNNTKVTLHREQGDILKRLLNGKNIILSAPTSFGKSFIIDALISLKKPKIIMIIVPTISLMDETRRRLTNKFNDEYKIITSPNESVEEKTILIFPQERVFGYKDQLTNIDLLIVDEFYKVSKDFDNERSDILLKAIMQINALAKQKYYLCPNINSITDISENFFSKDMEFIPKLDFKTVITEIIDYSNLIQGSSEEKKQLKIARLREIVNNFETTSPHTNTLIYAGSYEAITSIGNVLCSVVSKKGNKLLNMFSKWLAVNYSNDFPLVEYISRGIGVHNGQQHRSLSQLQTYLFSDDSLDKDGLHYMISTSSLIQGVNTSAENIIFWQRRNWQGNLKSLDYKNLIGRSGRMFRYFIGKVYLLDKPITDKSTDLELEFSDNVQGDINVDEYEDYLTPNKKEKIQNLQNEFAILLNVDNFETVINDNDFKSSNWQELLDIAYDIDSDKEKWKQLKLLNSENVSDWENPLLSLLFSSKNMKKKRINFYIFEKYIINSSNNWKYKLSYQIQKMKDIGITINDYFQFEKYMTYDFSALVNDVNILIKYLLPEEKIDISAFATKLSYAFLPPAVYYLEEYGLPRIISQNIVKNKLIDLEEDIPITEVITKFKSYGKDNIIKNLNMSESFDSVILNYFYGGIEKGK